MSTIDNTYSLKLITGEEILCRIDDIHADNLFLDFPIKLREVMGTDDLGEPEPAYTMMPWITSTEETRFTIPSDKVLIIAKITKDLASLYVHSVFHRRKKDAGSIKPKVLNYFHLP